MSQFGTEFRVGVFTLLGLAVTIFAIFVLSPDLFDTEEKARYHTVLKDAAGIMPKTHVKTNGVTVGKVAAVELRKNDTRVELEIGKDVKIPVGSTVEIKTVGFLGDKFVEINRSDKEELIPEGGLIPLSPDAASLNEVIAVIGSVAQDIKKITQNLASALGGQEGERTIREIVGNIETFTKDARDILADNKADVRALVANIKDFSKSLNEVLDQDNKEKIDRILASFDESMVEVKGATHNINLIAERVEKGEGTIGRLINDDETLEEIEGAIKDLRNVLAPVANLQVAVDYHGELRRDETSQHYFNLNFITRPDTHYVLGFTDLGVETVRETEKTLDADASDNEVSRETAIERKRELAFNLQFAKRWYWLGLRFGLFESTGGLASDIYMFGNRLKLSVEAFDFAKKDDEIRKTAHLKAYASVLFFNHVYALAGVDDPTRLDPETGKVDKKTNYFFGAGLTFNDQDLKALFGVAALASP